MNSNYHETSAVSEGNIECLNFLIEKYQNYLFFLL